MKKSSSLDKRILLAEDDIAISEVVSIILKDENYQVTIPKSFAELEKLVKKDKFDLILLDALLWGKNCQSICEEIKTNPSTKNIPVILVTARSDAKSVADSIGADDVIEKPFEIDVLLKRVKKYI